MVVKIDILHMIGTVSDKRKSCDTS